jgi:hypothetical protein
VYHEKPGKLQQLKSYNDRGKSLRNLPALEESQGNQVEERMHSEIPELLDRSNNIEERLPLVSDETRLAAGNTFCS